jgi:Na+-transporting methylmalonyl-CoA/oxaloacetate decarboxylase gamma subunit
MPGNYGYGWHQHLALTPGSLLGVAAPFLFLILLLVVLAAMGAVRGRVEAVLSRRRSPGTALPVVTQDLDAGPPVLASDRERDEAARIVADAVAEGRLSFEEGGERIDAVLRSRHRHELGGLVSDLPSGSASPSAQRFVATPLRLGSLVLAALVILAAVIVQAAVGLWELWPLAVVVLGTLTLLPAVRQRAQRALPASDW